MGTMLFFKRILDVAKDDSPKERRGGTRFAVQPDFPIKTVVHLYGRDDLGQLLRTSDGRGFDWAGRLVNVSQSGARVQLPRTVVAERDDPCLLKIDVQGFQLTVPGRIAHVSERRDSHVYGLALDLANTPDQLAYRQLVELIALGATLKQVRQPQPDGSGYIVEQFAGEPSSRLTIWRQLVGREVAAFEFQMKDCVVRGLAGRRDVECFVGIDSASGKRVTGEKGEEILRLYQWVVLNLAPAVPADVREFLVKHAA
jgi:hypothetical protein